MSGQNSEVGHYHLLSFPYQLTLWLVLHFIWLNITSSFKTTLWIPVRQYEDKWYQNQICSRSCHFCGWTWSPKYNCWKTLTVSICMGRALTASVTDKSFVLWNHLRVKIHLEKTRHWWSLCPLLDQPSTTLARYHQNSKPLTYMAASSFRPVKDDGCLIIPDVYSIPCEFRKFHTGKTGHSIETRIKEYTICTPDFIIPSSQLWLSRA
jgi:hypothetical protein